MNKEAQDTPKGVNKREATSPLYSEIVTVKKNRHSHSGEYAESESSSKSPDITTGMDDGDDVIHHLSQPIDPANITQIATELRSLMRPELKSLMEDFKPIIKDIVREAIHEATSHLMQEITVLKETNKQLSDRNQELLMKAVDLEKRLIEAERGNDTLEQYSRRNSIRISGIQELLGENTDNLVMKLADDLDEPILI